MAGGRHTVYEQTDPFLGLDLFHTGPAQQIITAGWDLNELSDLSDLFDV